MANQPNGSYASYLQAILDWAGTKRAGGSDPYALTSSNGNQGLDALLAQRGISLPDFNGGAIELGVPFTTGTAWLASYASALQSALGIGPSLVTASGGPSVGSSSDWMFYGGLALAAVIVLPKLLRRR